MTDSKRYDVRSGAGGRESWPCHNDTFNFNLRQSQVLRWKHEV